MRRKKSKHDVPHHEEAGTTENQYGYFKKVKGKKTQFKKGVRVKDF